MSGGEHTGGAGRRLWRGHTVGLAIVVGVLALFHGKGLGRLSWIKDDTDWLQQATLYGCAARTILGHHQFPARTHLLGGGFPVLGHPLDPSLTPQMALALLFGEAAGLNLYAIVLHLAAGVGMYLYVSSTLRLGRVAAVFAALLLMLASSLPTRLGTGCVSQLVYAWAPWALWLLHRGQRDAAALALLPVVLVTALLPGGSAWVAFALYLAGYAALHAVSGEGCKLTLRPGWLVGLGAAMVCAMVLAGPKVVAVMDVLGASGSKAKPAIRTHRDYYSPNNVVSLSWPELAASLTSLRYDPQSGSSSHVYVGLVPLLAAGVTVVLWGRRWWRHVVLLAGAVCLVLAWHAPVDLFRLVRLLPLVSAMDDPERYFGFFVVFEIAVLSSVLVAQLAAGRGRHRWVVLAGVPLVLGLGTLFTHTRGFVRRFRHDTLAVELPRDGYYQVSTICQLGRHLASRRSYYLMRAGLGTVDGLVNPRVPEHVQPRYFIDPSGRARSNSAYRGEAYFLDARSRAALVRMSPNEIVVRTDVQQPGTLVINQNYHRSWASDAGLVHEHEGLLAVKLDSAGPRQVRLRYVPRDVYAGVGLGLAMLAVLAAAGWRLARRRPRWWPLRDLSVHLASPRTRMALVAAGGLLVAGWAGVYWLWLRPTMKAEDLVYAGDRALDSMDEASAEAYYKQALKSDPDSGVAMRALARLYLEQRRLDEAAPLLSEAALRLSADPNMLGRSAVVYAALGRPEEGLALAQQTRAVDPLDPYPRVCIAVCRAVMGQQDAALDSLARAVEMGYYNTEWVRQTELLAALRQRPRFARIMRRAERIGGGKRAPNLARLRVVED